MGVEIICAKEAAAVHDVHRAKETICAKEAAAVHDVHRAEPTMHGESIAQTAEVAGASDAGENLVDLKELTPETLRGLYDKGYREIDVIGGGKSFDIVAQEFQLYLAQIWGYGAHALPFFIEYYRIPVHVRPEEWGQLVRKVEELSQPQREREIFHHDLKERKQEPVRAIKEYLAKRATREYEANNNRNPIAFRGIEGKLYIAEPSKEGMGILFDIKG